MTYKLDADRHKVDKNATDRRALGLTGRALLILVLLNNATRADLFSFDDPGTSIMTTVYLGALLVMAGSVVLFWRNFTSDAAPTGVNPNAVAPRRVYGLFSEPWYEVPAVSCMVFGSTLSISNLLADPPDSVKARWFLASLVLFVLVVTIGWLLNRAREKGKQLSDTTGRSETGWPATGPLSDPGFRLALVTYLLLSTASLVVVRIDTEPSSIAAWIFFSLGPVAAIAATVALILDLWRKVEPTS